MSVDPHKAEIAIEECCKEIVRLRTELDKAQARLVEIDALCHTNAATPQMRAANTISCLRAENDQLKSDLAKAQEHIEGLSESNAEQAMKLMDLAKAQAELDKEKAERFALKAEFALCYDPDKETLKQAFQRIVRERNETRAAFDLAKCQYATFQATYEADLQMLRADNARLAAACGLALRYLRASEAEKLKGNAPHYDKVLDALDCPRDALRDLLAPTIELLDNLRGNKTTFINEFMGELNQELARLRALTEPERRETE